ncbi:MAG: hypothetical protein ABUT20_38730 [Bacteroidota bacterium]
MKKIIFTISFFAYLATAIGIAVNIHYCMGKIRRVDYSYNDDNNNRCAKCGMKNKKGCCHNDSRFVKLTDDQQITKITFAVDHFDMGLTTTFVDLSLPAQGTKKNIALQYHSPPDNRLSSVYLHNCVFRI